MPPPGIAAVRWLGTTNFEIAYGGQVILLDAYYDRGPRNRPIGFGPRDVKRQIAATLPIVQLYNPRLYLPAHHDEIAGTFMDIGLEPLFMALRDQMPGTSWLSPLYREPVCIDIASSR